jgi:DNA-directed RNA polymerase specialized sigma subunit
MVVRNREREQLIYHARKADKRTFEDIERELGITGTRVRQIYKCIDKKINRR